MTKGHSDVVDQKFYESDTGDRLLEHYAKQYMQHYPDRAPDMPTARMLADVNPSTQALLGRGEGEHAYEKALVLAGIATEEERARVNASASELAVQAVAGLWTDEECDAAWAAERERAVLQAAEDAQLKSKVGAHEWQGEVLEVSAEVGYDLRSRYRQAALALHQAKEAAKNVEDEIKSVMGGFEHLAVSGEQIFHWAWYDSRSFNSKAFKEDPKRKALYDEFMVTKPARRFQATDGTVGVD